MIPCVLLLHKCTSFGPSQTTTKTGTVKSGREALPSPLEPHLHNGHRRRIQAHSTRLFLAVLVNGGRVKYVITYVLLSITRINPSTWLAIRLSSLFLRPLYHKPSQPVFTQEETAIWWIMCSPEVFLQSYICYFYLYFTQDIFKPLSHLLLEKAILISSENFLTPIPHLITVASNVHITRKKVLTSQAVRFSKWQSFNVLGFFSKVSVLQEYKLIPALHFLQICNINLLLSQCECDAVLAQR